MVVYQQNYFRISMQIENLRYLLFICLFAEVSYAGGDWVEAHLICYCFPLVLVCYSIVTAMLLNNLNTKTL